MCNRPLTVFAALLTTLSLSACASSTKNSDTANDANSKASVPEKQNTPSAKVGGVTEPPTGVIGNTLCLNATRSKNPDTYARIERFFGKGAVESPSDGVYTPQILHVKEISDDPHVGPHFAILAIEPTDVNLDFVSMANGGDRSRSEIKIAPKKVGVHTEFQARQGYTFIYTWRFRIEPGMKFSPAFTHIHQIKAYGGQFSDPPLITFTPLANGQMEVRHVGDKQKDSSTSTVLGAMALDGIPGQWLDVREEVTYANSDGRYRLSIIDQRGAARLTIDKTKLAMWRTGAEHMRPKWGIYRKHHAALNQLLPDHVYFANFGITRGTIPASSCR